MRVLDLFCGGGGAAEGILATGAEVTGVDLKRTANYPGEFVQGDALNYLEIHGREFDMIWASPPCQGYSRHVTSDQTRWAGTLGKSEPRLIEAVRERLIDTGKPWVIENVMSAKPEMRNPAMLCGSMFGLPISRHRLFETSEFILTPPHPKCSGIAKRYAEAKGWEYRDMSVTGKGRHAGTADRWKEIMGIKHHMTQHELRESIPPAYSRYIIEAFLRL